MYLYVPSLQQILTKSVSQLNHPGKTFGDFADFGFYSEGADKVVNLIEVGNGEGPVRGRGYFPSYEYYTRALVQALLIDPSFILASVSLSNQFEWSVTAK